MKNMTDEQVEMEIQNLRDSDNVKLAQREQRIKYKRRQYLYQLRYYEKRGKQLAELGATLENLEEFLYGEVIEE
ncbi:hypothetical protein [Ruminococcus sp.]|jgi:hypothetical protein|uniref:hypothetical protein n=2 Tax=Ruminococcus TaxID=1263 RepID=UPI0020704A07|nr:hypothetical protein [uncultured Ruminococcus sp.]DAK98262.1 MAG TPA: hypothetical protein [Bacteriophage sp.]DAZ25703.1 MAG TPA: hypothetical protein [Caudoviricetes sp.]